MNYNNAIALSYMIGLQFWNQKNMQYFAFQLRHWLPGVPPLPFRTLPPVGRRQLSEVKCLDLRYREIVSAGWDLPEVAAASHAVYIRMNRRGDDVHPAPQNRLLSILWHVRTYSHWLAQKNVDSGSTVWVIAGRH